MSKEENLFVTNNFSLCPYLEMNGLKYVKADVIQSRGGKVQVQFFFLDPEDKGKDLEYEFRFSSEKRYKEALFFYRKVINEKLGT